jgi:hypothetical protein
MREGGKRVGGGRESERKGRGRRKIGVEDGKETQIRRERNGEDQRE